MKQLYIFILSITIISCSSTQKDEDNTTAQKPELSIAKSHNFRVLVKPRFQEETKDWKELKNLDLFLKRFEEASPNEVLSNAIELETLIKNVKDSVKPKLFDNPSFNARLNILHNESLRLSDMINIPSIKAEHVNHQTEKLVQAYDALNAKINSILSKKAFEEAIDVDNIFIGLDSTKIDSVSKKTIQLNKKEELNRLSAKKATKTTSPKRPKFKNQ